jgi:hypothetical protein
MVESGYLRIRRRNERRSGMKIQSPVIFYPWHWCKMAKGFLTYGTTLLRLRAIMRRIEADPNRFAYRDAAIAPIGAGDTQQDLVASTRVTDYARRRMANSARARAEAVS